jgi:hypothetical protein
VIDATATDDSKLTDTDKTNDVSLNYKIFDNNSLCNNDNEHDLTNKTNYLNSRIDSEVQFLNSKLKVRREVDEKN